MATTDCFCRRCGVLNSASRQHCRECGASLAGGPEGPSAPPPINRCPHCGHENAPDAAACIACRTRLAPIARAPAGYTTEQEAAHSPLPCPACGVKMETGTAFLVRGGFWEQAFAGAHSWLQLVFRRDEALRLEKVVIPGQKVHAQRCPGCNAVWIGPPPPR